MEWVETTGRTLEEAKDAALDQLGVDEDDAEFDVLEEPKSGLFGRLRQEARVRARVRPSTPRPKVDRRDRGKRGGKAKRSTNVTLAEVKDGVEDETSQETVGSRPASAAKKRQRRPARQKVDYPEGVGMETDKTLAEQAEVAKVFVVGLLRAFDLEGSVDAHLIDDETIEVAVHGEGLGLLVGPRGATLASLQDLSRTALQHALGGARGARLRVDVGGYWERRRAALERFAQQVAAQVLESGSAVAMEPMDAADRKIVHDTVNDIDGVETVSDGEDSRRHVVIRPV